MANVLTTRARREERAKNDQKTALLKYKGKRWDELTPQEKDKIMGFMAESFGMVSPQS